MATRKPTRKPSTRKSSRIRRKQRPRRWPWLLSLMGLLVVGGAVWWWTLPVAVAPSMPIAGIDVSHYQGEVNWRAVAGVPGLNFVILKATEGAEYRDNTFPENVWRARDAGLHVGAYMLYTNNDDPDAQFANFLNYTQGRFLDMIPCIDVEENVRREHLSERVMRIVHLMEQHYGCKPLLYVNAHVYNDYLYPQAQDCELWIPNYSRQPQLKGETRPYLWQFSEKGCVDGIEGDVDLDCYVEGMNLQRLLLHKPTLE